MSDLRAIWIQLRESLWFVPSLILLGAVALAVGMVQLSTLVGDEALARWPRIFGVGADGSRSMLSAIAGSMITVAGVIFSITMVAVTQASTQYSPRVLRNFMRDRVNQTVLGVFVGIFAYCLVVLRTIRGGAEGAFVPSLAVLMGVVLAMVGVGVLIYFVHHVATILQAAEIVARIASDTARAIDELYPEESKGEPDVGPADPSQSSEDEVAATVAAPGTGYLQVVDTDRLVRLAVEGDLVIRLRQEPGAFVVSGQPVAACLERSRGGSDRERRRPLREIAEAASAGFRISTYRTFQQDAGFGFRQLVDVALKALSPGINDTTTAVTCVEYMGALLVQVCNRRIVLEEADDRGVVRVRAIGPTFESLLALATDEIRQHAGGNISVLCRQLDVLALVAGVTPSPQRRRLIQLHVERIRESAAATVRIGPDLDAIETRARRASALAAV